MPPRTRSSTPSTPSPKKQPAETTPRKTPRCSQCQRPRAGHPRQGCPYANVSPSSTKQVDLSEEINAMKLTDRSAEDQAIIRARRRSSSSSPGKKRVQFKEYSLQSLPTLDSICSEDNRTLTTMPQSVDSQEDSGDETEKEDDKSGVKNWRSSLPLKNGKMKMYPHSDMPGTLETPGSSFSSDVAPKEESVAPEVTVHDEVPQPRRVVRSLSWEDRQSFFQTAAEASISPPASLYTFPAEELSSYLKAAEGKGIFVQALPTEDPNEVAVVMGRDKKAVLMLYNAIKAAYGGQTKSAKSSSGLKAAAGGAVVGAVATFTSLAFS